jgi:glucosamine--fructose-6-phosphate aminotransferase (isomerizing)
MPTALTMLLAKLFKSNIHSTTHCGGSMCGIVGYIGGRDTAAFLHQGLTKLEYRGYDSVGVATLDNGRILVKKDVGKIKDVNAQLEFDETPGGPGIGHTRWATTGGVTKANAHPQLSCDKGIAIVHNGIIDNYKELRDELVKEGHKFSSETDSEVVAHLIEKYAKEGDTRSAFMKTVQQLRGSFALLAISAAEPAKLFVARNESPIVIGVGDNEMFVSSDVLPFLEYTKKAVYLDDGEIAELTHDSVSVYSPDGNQVQKDAKEITWDVKETGKNGYAHFMIKEIYDQPAVLSNTLKQDQGKLEEAAHLINSSPRVAIAACGTSRHAALVGRYVVSKLSGKYCEVYMASEFQYFIDKLGKETLIIAVSQSGETADVLIPVRQAKKQGCKVIAIVNVEGSSLDREADLSLYLNCGPEISVASTKAFTSQLAVFYLLGYTMAYKLDEGKQRLGKIPQKIRETLETTEHTVKHIAEKFSGSGDFYYIARGENFAVATEGALKLKEVSYIHAEGMPAGELKHGTLALITQGTPVVVICPKDHTYDETIANIAEIKARGGYVIGISDEPNDLFDQWLKIPKIDYVFYPLLANIPCQLLAYYLAVERGVDVDHPRNLAKSVTVK